MAKVIVPGTSELEKMMLAKRNIKLNETITVEDFEKEIIAYLKGHNVLHLATCMNNDPRSTALEYWNKGLTVFIFSERGGKIANIKKNANVCFSIADPFNPAEDFFGASGLQVWGKASLFKKNDDPEKFEKIRNYSHYGKDSNILKNQGIDFGESPFNFNVITIKPVRIRYLNLRKGYRNTFWRNE